MFCMTFKMCAAAQFDKWATIQKKKKKKKKNLKTSNQLKKISSSWADQKVITCVQAMSTILQFEDTILQELNDMIKKNGIAGQIYLCCVYTTKGMLRQFSLTLFRLQPM